ncbi:rRNA biogenesis protein rrp36 [Pyricularia oryzae]|nr:rRNA biogenesis protein rrp36 [Pyricularia oryzae]KAI6342227.1 rRNA biogenesis protein rrp36 [Pyricularia oryzae]
MELSGRKRKAAFDPERRVKVRRRDVEKADAWEPPSEDEQDARSSSPAEESDQGQEEDDDDEEDEEESGASEPEDDREAQLSFGARLRLSQKRQKPKPKGSTEQDPSDAQEPSWRGREARQGNAKTVSKAAASASAPGRKTKSAPEEMSSKRPVSRYREVVKPPPNARQKPRDVRFEQELTGEDYQRFRRNYAFLDEYRNDEMAKLREIIARKKGVTPADREDAKLKLRKMEDEKRSQERKDREHELMREHKKKEKELVKQGKKPFFLKKSEQKKLLLMDKYAGMSKGQVDKAIEKKRKKVAGKEKKQLPFARRAME